MAHKTKSTKQTAAEQHQHKTIFIDSVNTALIDLVAQGGSFLEGAREDHSSRVEVLIAE